MSENQYHVKAYLSAFNELQVPQRILDCEINLDTVSKRYFIATNVLADNDKDAQKKGMIRIDLILGIFEVRLGIHFDVEAVDVIQLFEPFLHARQIVLKSLRLVPLPTEVINDVKRLALLLDKLPNSEVYTKRANKSITFLRKGFFLEGNSWKAEAFLNYFKAMELISHDFKREFDEKAINQINKTCLSDLTAEEISELRTLKRLIQFTVLKLGITEDFDIPRIVLLRNQFGAHANLKDIEISTAEFNNCKILSMRAVFQYLDYLQNTKKPKN
jgi:hypothetical protein